MDFDHRDGNEKSHNVGSMVAHHYSKELIAQEIEKCDLVCANCHRVRTRDRRVGSGVNKQRNGDGNE
jgi:L-lysine 2,3-aminomutase